MLVNTGSCHFFNVLSIHSLGKDQITLVYLNDDGEVVSESVMLEPDHLDVVFTIDPDQ